MYAKLSALKQDLETLLRLGRTMVEEGGPLKIIADPAAFTQTLNQLKMFFNILGNKVSFFFKSCIIKLRKRFFIYFLLVSTYSNLVSPNYFL